MLESTSWTKGGVRRLSRNTRNPGIGRPVGDRPTWSNPAGVIGAPRSIEGHSYCSASMRQGHERPRSSADSLRGRDCADVPWLAFARARPGPLRETGSTLRGELTLPEINLAGREPARPGAARQAQARGSPRREPAQSPDPSAARHHPGRQPSRSASRSACCSRGKSGLYRSASCRAHGSSGRERGRETRGGA